jgi:hypothetical protein
VNAYQDKVIAIEDKVIASEDKGNLDLAHCLQELLLRGYVFP